MKKLLTILLAMLMALTLAACSSPKEEKTEATDLLEDIKNRGYLVIATEGQWSPYTYHDETTNELTGFDVELGKLIGEKLGVEVRFEETEFDSILAGVQSGRFDLGINGITYTEERAKAYNFSDVYASMDAALIVASDNETIKTFDDLEGAICTNSPGSVYADWSIDCGAKEINYVNTFQETANELVNGRADASINAVSAFNDYVRAKEEAGKEVDIKIVAYADPELYVIAAQKSDTTLSLVEEVNKILAELKADGTINNLSLEFFKMEQK